jgi:hypothetical protein
MPTEAPAAPPTAPTQPAPQPNAAPTPELHVTTETVKDAGPAPPPPKKGSARERMFADLRKKAESTSTSPDQTRQPGDKTPDKSGEAQPPENQESATSSAPEAAPADKKKVNPWKLLDETKAARAKAEAEIAELRKQVPDPVKAKESSERLQKIEERAKELEEEIRFVNYSKSQEFEEQYQKPYTEAWTKAMGELSELTIDDPQTGQVRPVAATDMLELVNLPLQKAREQANALFGDFADDVMAHRKEIRNLFDKQQKALADARKSGAERDEMRQKQFKEHFERTRKEISDLWDKTNQEVMADERIGRMFKPIDGDEEGNKRLQKGYEMADQAFAVDPRNPKLTPEERAKVVQLHVAIRNRAAAFGRVSLHLDQARAKIKSLTDELSKYKSTEPGKGEGKPQGTQENSSSAHAQVFGALRKMAH